MLETKAAHKLKVYIRTKKGRVRKFGRVRNVVFHPSKPQAVGITIKRPDLLLMIKRKDRFAAIDKLQVMEDGNLLADITDAQTWDKAACKRMGVDFDQCIIWDNMDVRNLDGDKLGAISNIVMDDEYRIESVDISSGGVERSLLGSADISAEFLKGYDPDAQAIVADIQREQITVSGGVAGKAGEAWAMGKHRVTESQEEISSKAAQNIEDTAVAAGEAIGKVRDKVKDSAAAQKASEAANKAGDAVNDGAYKLGRAIGKLREGDADELVEDTATSMKERAVASKKEADDDADFDAAAKKVGEQLRKTKGMFSAFKEEFDKASK